MLFTVTYLTKKNGQFTTFSNFNYDFTLEVYEL